MVTVLDANNNTYSETPGIHPDLPLEPPGYQYIPVTRAQDDLRIFFGLEIFSYGNTSAMPGVILYIPLD